MNWIPLTTIEQVEEIENAQGYSLIFKHSTRCSISTMAKRNLELDEEVLPKEIKLYFLDLIENRTVSNAVQDIFQVHHESPQALLIKDGHCILDQSHSDISAEEIAELYTNL